MQVAQPHLPLPGDFDELLRGASMLAQAEAALTASTLFSTSGLGRKIVHVEKQQSLFSQGDSANDVFYIQKGRVKLTVFAASGKEATLALLGSGDFAGEECVIVTRPQRIATAVALTPCTLLRIERGEMLKKLHQEKAFADLFVAFLLARNVRIQEDLIDQLFNSSEKRLARTLLLLARSGKSGTPATAIPRISQEALAEIVGTTRSRISLFMNRFRKLGYIDYNFGHHNLQVHDSLLNVVLRD